MSLSNNTDIFKGFLANNTTHLLRVHIKQILIFSESYWQTILHTFLELPSNSTDIFRELLAIITTNLKDFKSVSNNINIFRELLASNTTYFSRAYSKQYSHFQSSYYTILSHLDSLDILTLCETNLDDTIDSGNFPMRGYLPLIRKDSGTHMHGLTVYAKERLPFAQDLSLENSADSYLYFWLALLHSVSYFFFFLIQSAHSFIILMLFHLTLMRFFWSTHLQMCLSLETITSIIRTG